MYFNSTPRTDGFNRQVHIRRAISGHYGDYCLMAMVIFINNFPVYVTLDRGCQDGCAMLEEVYEEVIDFLREHY